MTGWPTASSIRFTWCLRPSWIVSSTRGRREAPRACRRRASVLELDALLERAQRVSSDGSPSTSATYDLLDLVARVREPVRELAVVRQQQRRRSCPRRAARPGRRAPAWSTSSTTVRPPVRVARGRDHAGRLVQQHVREPLLRERPSVELDAVARGHERVQLAGLAVHGDAAGLDQLVRATPRGDTGTREPGIEAHTQKFRFLTRSRRHTLSHLSPVA